MKRSIALLLTLTLCLGALCLTAAAANSNNPGAAAASTQSGSINYAIGAEYTISKNLLPLAFPDDADACFLPDYSGGNTYEFWGDTELTRLTDGRTVKGTELSTSGTLEGVTVALTGTNAIYEFIIDLGRTRTDISSVIIRGCRDGYSNGNSRGLNAETTLIYTSDEFGFWETRLDASYTKVELPDAPVIANHDSTEFNTENCDFIFTLAAPATGRYVRIITSSPAYVLQLDEIEVYGNSAAEINYGDVSGDNIINSLDAAQILKYDASLISLGADALAAADVSGDGIINSLDAAQVLKYDAELISGFPAQGVFDVPDVDQSEREYPTEVCGSWEATEEGITMIFTFNADGTGEVETLGIVMDMTWSVVNGKLNASASFLDETEEFLSNADYEVEGDTLTITQEGESVALTRSDGSSTEDVAIEGLFILSYVVADDDIYDPHDPRFEGYYDGHILEFAADGTGFTVINDEQYPFTYTNSSLIDESGDVISYDYDGISVSLYIDEFVFVYILEDYSVESPVPLGTYYVHSLITEDAIIDKEYISSLGYGDLYITFDADGTGEAYLDDLYTFTYEDGIITDEVGELIFYSFDGTYLFLDYGDGIFVYCAEEDSSTEIDVIPETYYIHHMIIEEEVYDLELLESLGMDNLYITFNADGTGQVYLDGLYTFVYNNGLIYDEYGDPINYSFDGDYVYLIADDTCIAFCIEAPAGVPASL